MTVKQWADDVLLEAQRNIGGLRRSGGKTRRTNATGRLKDSLRVEIKNLKGSIEIRFYSLERYSSYVHDGVNGRKSSPIENRNSKFRFKGDMPPPDEIEAWMVVKPVRIRDKSGRFKKKTKNARKQAAFAIARHIQDHGIRANPFFDDAIDRYLDRLDDVEFDLDFLIDDIL